jgi:hypothetical protein
MQKPGIKSPGDNNRLKHNPLLARLERKGNTDPAEGGVKLLENLQYAENGF